jgi:hypothetical protein
MATSGEKKWPPMGRNRWPLTTSEEACSGPQTQTVRQDGLTYDHPRSPPFPFSRRSRPIRASAPHIHEAQVQLNAARSDEPYDGRWR